MTDEKIIVQLASPERKYVKVYHDFLDNSFLSVEEQMIFIALKSYVHFRNDSGEVFPSINTLCKRAKMSKPRTIKAINNLIKKGIVKKTQRGLTKTNLYTLSDYAAMWINDDVKEIEAIVDTTSAKHLTLEEHIADLERMGYKVEIKEKELASDSSQTADTSTHTNNFNQLDTTINFEQSQDIERYTIDQIKQLFEYDSMLINHADLQQDIDSTMSVLHTAMNTSKPTIRIAGQDKPSMIVIAKLMKLDKESIIYAIDKFSKQAERIKNPTAYLLTILYNAPEQYYLDKKNQERNEMDKEDCGQEEKKADSESKDSKNNFANFKQRTYDYDQLEREMISRQKSDDVGQSDNEFIETQMKNMLDEMRK